MAQNDLDKIVDIIKQNNQLKEDIKWLLKNTDFPIFFNDEINNRFEEIEERYKNL